MAEGGTGVIVICDRSFYGAFNVISRIQSGVPAVHVLMEIERRKSISKQLWGVSREEGVSGVAGRGSLRLRSKGISSDHTDHSSCLCLQGTTWAWSTTLHVYRQSELPHLGAFLITKEVESISWYHDCLWYIASTFHFQFIISSYTIQCEYFILE